VALRGDRDNAQAAGRANDLLLTRERFSPVYTRLLASGNAGSERYFTEERMLGRRSIALGTRSDSYELNWARRLKLQTDVVVAGHDSNQSLLHVAYAIPGSALHEVPSDRGHLYPVRLRLSVLDRTGRPVISIDTTRTFIAHDPVPPSEHLVGQLRVPVIPGPLVYRLAVEQGADNGVILAADTITAGDFSGQSFELSGLILGSRDANLTWRPTPTDTVWFNPLGRYRHGTTMELYYEVYGLAAGAEVRTEVLVMKEGSGGFLGIFGSKKPAIRLAFEDRATGVETRFNRTVPLQRLSPGRYRIEVQARDASGAVRRNRAAFEIRD
jgi:hypothetical protein